MTPSTRAVPSSLTVHDFDFALPEALIAQCPSVERSGSRLLDASDQSRLVDCQMLAWPELLCDGDLLVVNDTRVIKARLFGRKASGGAVEVLVERVLPGTFEVWCHLRASKSPKAGQRLVLGLPTQEGPATSSTSGNHDHALAQQGFEAEVLGRAGPQESLFHVRFSADPLTLLERYGHVPLPPYITHADTADDERRYQTVFAAKPGAVAAPTAALHLDESLLARIAARGVERAHVTLHVGAGTFQPVRVERLADHRMHQEWFEVDEATVQAIADTRARGGRVVAVGTTTVRALESAARAAGGGPLRAMRGDTDIFITPGFEFQVVDRLLTNFHLPKSTLLMLVSAFAGRQRIRDIYRHAIEERYRFFSYGDAMYLARAVHEPAR